MKFLLLFFTLTNSFALEVIEHKTCKVFSSIDDRRIIKALENSGFSVVTEMRSGILKISGNYYRSSGDNPYIRTVIFGDEIRLQTKALVTGAGTLDDMIDAFKRSIEQQTRCIKIRGQ